MILTPIALREFVTTAKDALPEINFAQVVIDDSQMANSISEQSANENLLLYGVLPDYNSDTRQEDGLMMDNGFDFLVLKKSVESDLTNDELMEVMEATLLATKKLIELIFEEKNNPNTCPQFYFLKEESIQITPVWAKAGTNGYMLSLNLRTAL